MKTEHEFKVGDIVTYKGTNGDGNLFIVLHLLDNNDLLLYYRPFDLFWTTVYVEASRFEKVKDERIHREDLTDTDRRILAIGSLLKCK